MSEKIDNEMTTDMLEQQLNNEINREENSLWYNTTIGLKETKLIIKTITPCIKALISGCPLKLVFGKKDDYLCIGVRIFDILNSPLFISKVQYKSEEHKALIYALQEGRFDISLLNEMDKLLAWSKVTISEEKALDVLNWMQDESSLYAGTRTKKVDYAHDCFCVSVESTYKHKFPNAHTIPYIELETTIDSWNTMELYFYSDQNIYNFNIQDRDEGGTFEKEIASALTSVFPSTLYRNPKFRKGTNDKELTDILAFYKYGSFLIEAKEISIIDSSFDRSKTRRILKIQNKVKQAIKQMAGATKVFMKGTEIYTSNNEKINVNRIQPPHCIILITEFMHDGDWSEVQNLLFNAINETGAMFNIMDFGEFIELLKASSGKPEIIDYNLMQRWKCLMKNHSIHVKGTYE